MADDEVPPVQDNPDADMAIIKRSIGLMLGGMIGHPLDARMVEAVLTELGYKRLSPLVV